MTSEISCPWRHAGRYDANAETPATQTGSAAGQIGSGHWSESEPTATDKAERRAAGVAVGRTGLIDRRFEIALAVAKGNPPLANRQAAIRLAFDAAIYSDKLVGRAFARHLPLSRGPYRS